jgi:hypothetical protein
MRAYGLTAFSNSMLTHSSGARSNTADSDVKDKQFVDEQFMLFVMEYHIDIRTTPFIVFYLIWCKADCSDRLKFQLLLNMFRPQKHAILVTTNKLQHPTYVLTQYVAWQLLS